YASEQRSIRAFLKASEAALIASAVIGPSPKASSSSAGCSATLPAGSWVCVAYILLVRMVCPKHEITDRPPRSALINSVHVSTNKNNGHVCSYDRCADSRCVRRTLTLDLA